MSTESYNMPIRAHPVFPVCELYYEMSLLYILRVCLTSDIACLYTLSLWF